MRKVRAASLAVFALAAVARAQAPVFGPEFQVNTYTTGGAVRRHRGEPRAERQLRRDVERRNRRRRRRLRRARPDVRRDGLSAGRRVHGDRDRHERPGDRARRLERERRLRRDLDRHRDPAWRRLPGLRAALQLHRDAAGRQHCGQHVHDRHPGILERRARLDGQLRRRLAEHRAGRRGFRCLRPALQQRRRQGRQPNSRSTSRRPAPQRDARVARRPTGEFMVVWRSPQDDQGGAVMARRYQANGTPVAGEFQVNTRELGYQYQPDAAYFSDGSAIIVWTSYGQDGSNAGVYGQRLDASGAKLGPEFNVNTYTTGFQGRPSVAVGPDGDFAVIWQSAGQDGSDLAIRAQQFDPTGKRLGVELPVNDFTTGLQGAPHVTAQPNGQYVAVWDSVDRRRRKQHRGAARRASPKWATIAVDAPRGAVADGSSNHNRVLEAGRSRRRRAPRSRTTRTDPLPLDGHGLEPPRPSGPDLHARRRVGRLRHDRAGATNDCFAVGGDCLPGRDHRHASRPALGRGVRRDALVRRLHPDRGAPRRRQLPRRAPDTTPSIRSSRTSSTTAVTGGCAGGGYCPANNVTRAQMAVFLLKARWGSLFLPAPATGTAFPDVPASNPFAPWIEELVREGITAGCGGGLYCPDNPGHAAADGGLSPQDPRRLDLRAAARASGSSTT